MIAQVLRTRQLTIAVATFALAFAGVTAVLALNASSASAGPSVCEQYPDLPQCGGAPGGGGDPAGGGDGDSGDEGPAAGGGDSAGVQGPSADLSGGRGGDLPFTGYPMTALILLLVVLLLAGLGIRSYLAVRDRVADDDTAGP